MEDGDNVAHEESKTLLHSSQRWRPQQNPPRSWPLLALAFVCGLLVSLATVIVLKFAISEPLTVNTSVDVYLTTRPPLPPLTSGTDPGTSKPASWFSGLCGRTSSTARAANCSLDLTSLSWFPPGYLSDADRADEAEFLALRPWKYTLDDDRTQRVDNLRALLESDDAPDRIYVDGEWHPIHCAYMFRRLQRKFAAGDVVDGYVASEGHAAHCSGEIADTRLEYDRERAGHLVMTRVYVKSPECI